jgi:ABC-2 type transport system permease protein
MGSTLSSDRIQATKHEEEEEEEEKEEEEEEEEKEEEQEEEHGRRSSSAKQPGREDTAAGGRRGAAVTAPAETAKSAMPASIQNRKKRPLLEGQAIYSMCLRELIRFFRMKTRTISALVSPFTWMILFGLPLSRLFPQGNAFGGLPFFAFVVPGILGMGLLFSGTNSGVTVPWDKEFGFLKEVMVAPVRRTSLMLGRSLGAMAIAMFQGLLTMAIALLFGVWFGFHIVSIAGFFVALAFMIVTFLTFVGFGLTLGALIEGTEGFMALVSMIEMPLFFLSGGMFPVNEVKGIPVLYQVRFLNPLTYGVDGLRGPSLASTSCRPCWTLRSSQSVRSSSSFLGRMPSIEWKRGEGRFKAKWGLAFQKGNRDI